MIRFNSFSHKAAPIIKVMHFPAGELHVTLEGIDSGDVLNMSWFYENNEELLTLLFVADAARRLGGIIGNIFIPYFPFGRQDRVANEGEAFSLAIIANLINSIGAESITVTDPHSDVTPALINNIKIISQAVIAGSIIKERKFSDFNLIAVDGGALKKIRYVAKAVVDTGQLAGIVTCEKERDTATGAITGTVVHADDLAGRTCIMVDDICDGGATFVEVAKVLKAKNAGQIILIVSHGFFTKGLEVFDGLVDEIYTRNGRQFKEQANNV